MRTTLSIDDDVLVAARERAHRDKRTIGEVISELARQALNRSDRPPGDSFHGFRPLPRRGGLVSNTLIDRLREDEDV